ncbi:Hypothetical protein A7982_03849 [Minicystis rosea]|nr:Hypothetical protein A7982_03849 [Minicystis rosea]
MPFGDGFLVAAMNLFSADPDCSADTLTVIHRVRAGESPVLVGGFDGYAVVAPHPEGLWAAWPKHVDDAPPQLELRRIDGATGEVVVSTTLADVDPGSFAIASMGRSLALAWTPIGVSLDTAPPEVHVRVLTESGAKLGEAVLPNLDAPGRISVAASPDARSIVVAWGQWWSNASRISMARADCIGGS